MKRKRTPHGNCSARSRVGNRRGQRHGNETARNRRVLPRWHPVVVNKSTMLRTVSSQISIIRHQPFHQCGSAHSSGNLIGAYTLRTTAAPLGKFMTSAAMCAALRRSPTYAYRRCGVRCCVCGRSASCLHRAGERGAVAASTSVIQRRSCRNRSSAAQVSPRRWRGMDAGAFAALAYCRNLGAGSLRASNRWWHSAAASRQRRSCRTDDEHSEDCPGNGR